MVAAYLASLWRLETRLQPKVIFTSHILILMAQYLFHYHLNILVVNILRGHIVYLIRPSSLEEPLGLMIRPGAFHHHWLYYSFLVYNFKIISPNTPNFHKMEDFILARLLQTTAT